MRRFMTAALIAFSIPFALRAEAPSGDPDGAKIVVEDIDRFWEAFDAAGTELSAGTFQKLYLDRGTPGLRDFVELRITNAEELAKTIRQVPRLYASFRESSLRVREKEKEIRASFYALEYLYPEAVFPDVYFMIGRLNSGGTTSDRGLLIGAEMFGRTPQTPESELNPWLREVLAPAERIPHIVAHELIHFEQKLPAETAKTLLGQSINEGSADFLAELISGRHINHHVHAFAKPREAELWKEFRGKMNGEDMTGWLYTRAPGRPNDLGYWMGYEITKSYFDKAADKRQAIKEILTIQDFGAFLAKSGYAERFTEAPGK